MRKANYLFFSIIMTLLCCSTIFAETEIPNIVIDARNAFYQSNPHRKNVRNKSNRINNISTHNNSSLDAAKETNIEAYKTIKNHIESDISSTSNNISEKIISSPNEESDVLATETNEITIKEDLISKDIELAEEIEKPQAAAIDEIKIANETNNNGDLNEDDGIEDEEDYEDDESENPEMSDPENADDDSDATDGSEISDDEANIEDDDEDDDIAEENNEENEDEADNASSSNEIATDTEKLQENNNEQADISSSSNEELITNIESANIPSSGNANTSLYGSLSGLTLEQPEEDEEDEGNYNVVYNTPAANIQEISSEKEKDKKKTNTDKSKQKQEKNKNAAPKTTYNILMVGNSKTYYNNLATMFEKLVNRAKKEGKVDFKVNVEQFAFNKAAGKNDYTAGLELKQIYKMRNSKILAKLKSKKWDYIILEPGSAEEFKEKQMTWDLNTYYKIAKKKNPDLKVILYMSQLNMGKYDTSYPAKINKIAEAAVAKCKIPQKNIRIAYAYSAYKEYHKNHKEWSKLYQKDKLHSSVEGSYLIACVLYSTLTGKSPVGIAYTGGVSKKDITTNKKDLSGKNGTWYCHSPVHKGVSNPKQYQEYAWTVEKNKSKFSVK